MELSSAKMKEAKSLGVSMSELIFADLISLGYAASDAYTIAYPEDMGSNMQNIRNNRERVLRKTSFQNLCEERRKKNAMRLQYSGDISELELIDNETAAKEILKIARQMPENSKERGEMFMKYADLTRKNDQKTEDVAESINFYFPLKCHQCPFLIAHNDWMRENNRKKGEEIRPVEMEAIIRAAWPIIEKARKKAGN